MKFRCSRLALLEPLTAAAAAATAGGVMPILGSVLLDAAAGRIVGTDLQIEIAAGWSCEGEGAVAVPASRLLGLVEKLPPGAEVVGEVVDDRLRVVAGGASAWLSILPAHSFPVFPLGEPLPPVVFPVGRLAEAFTAIEPAMAVRDVRHYLNGAYLTVGGGRLLVVGSDGHRLAKFEAPTTGEIPPVIIPRDAVKTLLRRFKRADSVSVCLGRTGAGDSWSSAAFDLGDVTLSTKLLEGKYPSIDRVWPRETPFVVTANRGELIAALGMAAPFGGELSAVTMEATQDFLVVSSSHENQELKTNVSATAPDPYPPVGFNAKYLLDAMNILGSADVDLRFNEGMSVCLVAEPEDETKASVVMPIRL